ncbi:MAG: DUF6768 family protein [Novosphingobium sp.]
MTNTLDQQIDAALAAEERELLRAIGEEPGFYTQFFGLFRDSAGWVSMVLMAVQTVLFIASVWAGWRFFTATETLEALRWGLPAAVLALMALAIKLSMWPTLQANRVIREVKRLELLIARR